MAAVQEQVESHYRSDVVEGVRRNGGIISVGDVTVRLAKQFGFCYGVDRASDPTYAAINFIHHLYLKNLDELIHKQILKDNNPTLIINNRTEQKKQANFS